MCGVSCWAGVAGSASSHSQVQTGGQRRSPSVGKVANSFTILGHHVLDFLFFSNWTCKELVQLLDGIEQFGERDMSS